MCAYRSANTVCTSTHEHAMVSTPIASSSASSVCAPWLAFRNASTTPTRLTSAAPSNKRWVPARVSSSRRANSSVSSGVKPPIAVQTDATTVRAMTSQPIEHGELPGREPRHDERRDPADRRRHQDPGATGLRAHEPRPHRHAGSLAPRGPETGGRLLGMAPVVTLSASFGAGGSFIGPRVAEALDLPFLDRAIPVAVADALAVPMSDVMAHDERRASGMGRLFASLARAAAAPDTAFGSAPTAARASLGDQPEQAFREQTERVLRQIADEQGGVILGRAAAIVLRDRSTALHVRLDGPPEARIRRAMGFEGLDEDQARKLLGETDRAREAYVKYFYKCDARDASHYHLVIDSTALEFDTCVDLIVAAARARTDDLTLTPRILASLEHQN